MIYCFYNYFEIIIKYLIMMAVFWSLYCDEYVSDNYMNSTVLVSVLNVVIIDFQSTLSLSDRYSLEKFY